MALKTAKMYIFEKHHAPVTQDHRPSCELFYILQQCLFPKIKTWFLKIIYKPEQLHVGTIFSLPKYNISSFRNMRPFAHGRTNLSQQYLWIILSHQVIITGKFKYTFLTL